MDNKKYFSPETIIETQKKFMESWFDIAQDTMNQNFKKESFKPANSEFEILDTWQDFLSRITLAGKSYFDMAERFSGMSQDGMTLQQICNDWVDQFSAALQQMMNQPMPDFNDVTKNPAAFWDMPQDTWNRTFSTLFPFPGDVFRAFRPEGLNRMPGDIHGHLDQFLATPSIGYTRESQEKYKQLARLMLGYHEALNAYNVAMAKVGSEALAAFQHRVTKEFNKENAEISFKSVYKIWTETAEEIYGAYVLTDEYSKIYGHLVNEMMAVKKQTAKMVDEFCEALNMPTRKEINTLHKRMQETRRQFDITISTELEELKERLDALEEKTGKSKTKTAPKKPASKKPAAKKVSASVKAKKTTKKPEKKLTKKLKARKNTRK